MLRTPSAVRRLAPLCLLGLLVLLSPGVARTAGEAVAGGVQWRDLTLDQALDEAKAKDQFVMIDFWAAHCHSCGVMKTEVWDTPAGGKLAEGVIPIQLNSVDAAGKAAAERYPLTGLPCVIFLRPDGTEIDRVEGYTTPQEFLYKITPIKEGVDQLPAMEAILKEHPDSLQLMINVLEKYMYRKRAADIDILYKRILDSDSKNQKGMAERAIVRMGRYKELVLHDEEGTISTWKMMVEKYPWCPSVGGALDGVWTALMNLGRAPEWLDWCCSTLEKNPSQMTLQRAAVSIGLRGGYRSPCLAKAARASRNSFAGREVWYDSVAVVFEGGTWPPPGYVRPAAPEKKK